MMRTAGVMATMLVVCAAASGAMEYTRTRPPCVVVAADAAAPERTAAGEVADYLGRILGVRVPVVPEPGAAAGRRIFVGHTRAATRAGLDDPAAGPEAWRIRTVRGDLYLVGGRPRGTLYAAYHFLEDVAGVHWWNPWEESVPTRRRLAIGSVDLHGSPAFRYRDIYMVYGNDGGRFAARNRLNREGDAAIDARYGGSQDYGPPYHVHTAYSYVPPAEHFAAHPEWYSLIDGKRTTENAQLCWTDPGLRRFFRERLQAAVASSRAAARAAGLPPPAVYSISQNDCYGACRCPACKALSEREGCEAGPLIDFVNEMADAVRGPYPDIFIDTLAYQYTQKAPKHIRPRDNVIIRLCDTEADMIKPITDPANKAFRDHILSWAAIARNLRVWDYAITYGAAGMPLPTIHTFGPDLRFYRDHHVEGVFTELEDEVLADLRDLKVWMLVKTLENPDADAGRLRRTFLDGFYGRAGHAIGLYLRALERESTARKAKCTCWQGSPTGLAYLNPTFVAAAQRLFDEAEQAVRSDPTRLRRVRQARLSLDRATVALYPTLAAGWRGRGPYPISRNTVARRALATWLGVIDQRIPEPRRDALRMSAEGEMQRYAMVSDRLKLPEQFRGAPAGTVWDFTAVMTRNFGSVVKVVKDPGSETGITNRIELAAADVEHPERYTLPMPWGLYTPADKSTQPGDPITAEAITGPGYQWYRMGSFTVAPTTYAWFFWSWLIQLDIDNVLDPAKPGGRFEVWARVKFEGPRFPHARAGQADAICVERVIVRRLPPMS